MKDNDIINPSSIVSYSTFEDAIPEHIKKEWFPVEGELVHKIKSEHLYKCPIHKTMFNRAEEPCWQCYNPYE